MRSSASQIATAELCLRKWAWRYIDGVEAPPNKYAQHGTDTHNEIEQWLTKRIKPQNPSAAAIVPALPPPQDVDPRLVEVRFQLNLAGAPFIGFVDLYHDETVYDHKTTSDLKWAKSSEDLLTDPQATLYAYWAMTHFKLEQVGLQWTYVTRHERPRVLPVRNTATLELIMPRIERTAVTVRECKAIEEAGVTAIEVPYDAAGCEAFGGCPYRELCNLSPREKLGSIMTQGAKSAFLQRLQERKAAMNQPHPPPAEGAGVNPPAPPPKEEAPAPPPKKRGRPKKAKKAEETPVPPPKEEAPPSHHETARLEEAQAPAPPPKEEEPSPPPKKKRGRPKKAEETPVPPPKEEAPPIHRETARLGFTLYVNCSPVKVSNGQPRPELASTRIQRLMAEFTRAKGVTHYRVIPYGEGAGIFAAAVAHDLQQNPPEAGAIIIHTNTKESLDTLQAFEAAAETVVMGHA
jgi:hypothetical protein